MEWIIWITWWVIFYIRYSRLFEYILKRHGENINDNNPSIKIYVNKIKDRITFKIKTGYYLKLLTHETMKLLGSTKSKIKTDENGENLPHLEITEVVLIQCNIFNDNYQQNSRVMYTFVPNKWFGQFFGYFTRIFYIFKNFWLRIFIFWSMVNWSKFQTARDRK